LYVHAVGPGGKSIPSPITLESILLNCWQSDTSINYQMQVEPPFKTAFDTKDLFHGSSSFQDPQE